MPFKELLCQKLSKHLYHLCIYIYVYYNIALYLYKFLLEFILIY